MKGREAPRKGREGAPSAAPEASTTDAPITTTRRRRPEPTPVQRALGLLTRREHSSRELTRKLIARGIAAGEARATVERLASAGWQDDARFAELLVRSRASAGYGPVRVRAELGTHGLDREAIATSLDESGEDWSANARSLVRRRFGAEVAQDRALQRRAADFLIRRGFTADQIRAAIRLEPDDP
jgi:regulatory protein